MTARILVVEDEPGQVLTLTDRLRSEGYEVEAAGDGEAGLTRARAGRFDLIILDVMLPKKGGFDVCRDLRLEGVHTPVLMLTARGQVADRVVGLKLGADDYLVKPFEMAELLARVEARLRRAVGAAPALAPSRYSFGDVAVDFRRAEIHAAASRSRCRPRSCSSCGTSSSTAAPRSRATSCSTACGATTRCPRLAPWTCTWPGCAASWSPIPTSRGTSHRARARLQVRGLSPVPAPTRS